METAREESLGDAATHAIEEARMILPGAQAFLGFQLVAVFSQRFEKLTDTDQTVHLAAFFLISLAMGLLMTPAAYHRLVEGRMVTQRFIALSSCLISLGLVPLMMGVAIDGYILVRLVARNQGAAFAAGAAIAVVLTGLWFVLPLGLRASKSTSSVHR